MKRLFTFSAVFLFASGLAVGQQKGTTPSSSPSTTPSTSKSGSSTKSTNTPVRPSNQSANTSTNQGKGWNKIGIVPIQTMSQKNSALDASMSMQPFVTDPYATFNFKPNVLVPLYPIYPTYPSYPLTPQYPAFPQYQFNRFAYGAQIGEFGAVPLINPLLGYRGVFGNYLDANGIGDLNVPLMK